ncbi:MAG: SurA N-terminal domain-containing protein [Alphaproteobacteria bacterium]
MLDSLRSFAGSPLGIAVFIALIFGLLFFGLSGFSGNSGVAQVGQERVLGQEFSNAYNDELQNIAGIVTPTRAWDQGLPQNVLSNLIQQAVIRDETSTMNMGLSDDAVAATIALDPFFQSDGQFNPDVIQRILVSQDLSEAELIDDFRAAILQNQLFLAIRGGEPVLSETYRRILAEFYGEQRTIEYAVLTSDILDHGRDPTDEELAAFYDDSPDLWQIDEVRNVVLLELSPRMLADPSTVTDEDVEMAYEARRVAVETRDVWIHVFDDRDNLTAAEAAEAAALAIDSGQTFDDLIAVGDIDPTNLGGVGAGGINDPAIGDAAFELQAGETRIVDGRAGATLVHVAEIASGDLPPIDEIADEIRQELAESRTAGTLAELGVAIDEGREAGQTLVEVGEALGLTTLVVAFDADGNDGVGSPISDLPGGNALLTRAFEADIGTASSPVSLGVPGAALWYEVMGIAEPRQLTLDEIRDRVVEAWTEDADQLRIEVLAESIAGLLNDGISTTEIEAELGVEFLTSEALSRTSQPPAQTTITALQAAYSAPLGGVATVANAAGDGRVVLRVSEILALDFDPDADLLPDVLSTAENIARQVAITYVADLQDRISITVNWDLVRQITGLPR